MYITYKRLVLRIHKISLLLNSVTENNSLCTGTSFDYTLRCTLHNCSPSRLSLASSYQGSNDSHDTHHVSSVCQARVWSATECGSQPQNIGEAEPGQCKVVTDTTSRVHWQMTWEGYYSLMFYNKNIGVEEFKCYKILDFCRICYCWGCFCHSLNRQRLAWDFRGWAGVIRGGCMGTPRGRPVASILWCPLHNQPRHRVNRWAPTGSNLVKWYLILDTFVKYFPQNKSRIQKIVENVINFKINKENHLLAWSSSVWD